MGAVGFRHDMGMNERTTYVRSGNGAPIQFTQGDWEAFIDLLDAAGVHLEGLVMEGRLDGEAAAQAMDAVRAFTFEVVETGDGARIRVQGGTDTDPVTALTARVASGLALPEVAQVAQRVLLTQAASATTRPLRDEEEAKVATWIALLSSGDDLYVSR